MIDLAQIPEELILARGRYATVRAAHEDEKARMAKLGGNLNSLVSMLVKMVQPDEGNEFGLQQLDNIIDAMRENVTLMAECGGKIHSLGAQRNQLKEEAWPKR